MRLGARREPPRRQRVDGDDHVRQASRAPRGRLGAREHDGRGSAIGRSGCRAGAQGAARSQGRGAAVVDPRRARHFDARELRRVSARGTDAEAGRDRRGPAGAVRAGGRRGQGRRLQHRPDAGARARVPARAGRLHGSVRARTEREPGCACAPLRLSRPRRRAVSATYAGHHARRHAAGRLEACDHHQVATPGKDLLVHTDLAPAPGSTTIEIALKIWRYDAVTGDKELKRYEIEAPDWVTLLDIIKDKHDGTLAYRKSCRMMICGSCGMRMDGAAVLACKTRMYDIAKSGHVPVISSMGNMPVIKDLVVDMDPFWGKIRRMKPWLDPGYEEPLEQERIVSQQQMNVIHKEALCIMCGCCVSECNSMESDPEFFGPAALAKGMRFVGDPRDQADVARLNDYNDEHGIWDCTRCYFCNERCPKGVDPRDAIAKLGAESIKQGIDHDMGAKHANWFVTSAKTTGWLRETELVPKTQGMVSAVKEIKFALNLARRGKVPPPVPPHVAERVEESRRLYHLVKEQGRDGALGIVQGEHALGRIEF